MGDRPYIHWLEEISLDDIADVGGKSASLGEMYQSLVPRGIRIPKGFAVSVEAYRDLLDQANAWKPLRELLRYYAGSSDGQEIRAAEKACTLIYEAELPDELDREIVSSYVALCEQYGPLLRVAVRRSATAEDLPDAIFSGQYDRFLNIGDKEGLLDACRSCFASLFTERAISYREHHGLDHFKVYLAIVVMKMVRADLAASGVMFTLAWKTAIAT
ncbi:PEP/pyruvate-binding domain-containing protein [Microbulbifer litoralis]|uniref:PEP/pyruvate-binding domain-containing protein n=1 Tax=Microbulbifer litoralis TaxID=2933965 RepID=UPI00202947A5|nr:PEP/pyruvate-binding domain-containing protein [Microbulbifer sp. GX H0434]